jgi:hypothetical protein
MLNKNKYSEILGLTSLVGLYGIYKYYYEDINPKKNVKEETNILASYSNSNDDDTSEIYPTDYESTDDEISEYDYA